MTMRDAIGGVAMSIPPLGPEQPERRRWRLLAIAVIGVVLALAFVGTSKVVRGSTLANCSAASGPTAAVSTDCSFAGFEIDGDTPPNNGGLDWQSSPQVFGSTAYTPFYDLSNSTSDNIMGRGSKENDQSTWACVTQKADAKNDLGATFLATDYSGSTTQFNASGSQQWAGAIWFETVNSKQFLFGSFQRLSANGDAHVDFEFNRAKKTFTCGADTLATRENGDVLITFDGNGPLTVNAFTWVCTHDLTATDPNACTAAGSFTGANVTAGDKFAGQTNTATQTDPGLAAGVFGEAGLDLTDTIGSFTCGEFGTAFMKDRTSTASDIATGTAEVKDYVAPQPFNPGLCPSSSVSKAQADETTQSADASGTAESGSTDMTADAALTYTKECSGGGGTPTPASASAGCATGASTTPLLANAGDEIGYKVTYHNAGPGTAPNPVVQDNISAATGFTGDKYVAGSQSCPTSATCWAASSSSYNSTTPCSSNNAASGDAVTHLVWCLPQEAAGDVPLYYEVTLPSTATGSGTEYFGNYATVTDTQISSDSGGSSNFVAASASFSPSSSLAKKEADVQPSNQYCDTASGGAVTSNTVCNSLLGTALSECVSPAVPPGCFVFSSGPINAAPGDIIEYKLTYTNNGDSPATNVVISDSIPKNSTYVASSAAGADSPTITCLNGTTTVSCTSTTATVTSITWKYSSVAIAGSEAVTFKVTAASTFPGSTSTACSTTFTASQIGNCASVVTDQDNASSGKVIANVAGTGALNLVKSATVSGNQITYTISYFNTGDQAITTAQSVSDLIPTGLTFVSCSGGTNTNTGTASSPNTCGGTTGAGGTVTWMVNNVGAGTTATSPAGTLTLVVTQ